MPTLWKTHPFKVSVDDTTAVQVFQSSRCTDQLPKNYYGKKTDSLPSLTRSRRLCFGWALMKSMIFPFSIRAETIEMGGGVDVTPINGRIFLCWSHFHPTTSLTRSSRSRVSDRLTIFRKGTYLGQLLAICCAVNLEGFDCDRLTFERSFVDS